MAEAVQADDRMQRLHRISGVLALGPFLVGHLVAQAAALGGSERYAQMLVTVDRLRVEPLVELVVWPALVIHVVIGLLRLRVSHTSDVAIARWGDRRLWTAQRISAAVLLVFVAVHLWELPLQRVLVGVETQGFLTLLAARLSWTWAGVPWRSLLYVVGIAAAAFHFQNGLFAATAPREADSSQSRRRARIVSAALGVLLFLVGAATVVGVATGTRLLPAADANSPSCGH